MESVGVIYGISIWGIVNLACGLLFILISIPLVTRKVPMNKWYGFRIAKAFESEDNWYRINQYGGRQLIQWSVLLIVIGLLYFIFPVDEQGDGTVNVWLAAAPILICTAVTIAKTIFFARQL